ncbi:MAG: peptidoglycan bridge formation glycyltransferase FemA/FemB family protein [Candidatus Parcubacteria bacterium]|nr:peptidoglycan bridge formation glycyltransferase FemA/FemB family protein [Candidatus Parcubacteria bacterium]
MEIQFLNDKTESRDWNRFLSENNGSFLQSFEWGEFEHSLGKNIWRIRIKEGEKIVSQSLIIEEIFPLKKKTCLYIPFGPVLNLGLMPDEQQETIGVILDQVKIIAKKQGSVFLKIEPNTELIFPKNSVITVPNKRIQPQRTLILNLLESEQEIFENFSSKTRYNIRLAEKKGVRIKFEEKYHKEFYRLIKGTSERDNFTPFREEHYKKLFDVSSDDFKVKLCLAEYENKIIASYILILFNKTATGLHGANDWQYRALKPANFLQWERIKLVKNLGYEKFDFWGVDDNKWKGITDFKRGFGGKEVIYPQSKDIVFQKGWYKLYNVARKII